MGTAWKAQPKYQDDVVFICSPSEMSGAAVGTALGCSTFYFEELHRGSLALTSFADGETEARTDVTLETNSRARV